VGRVLFAFNKAAKLSDTMKNFTLDPKDGPLLSPREEAERYAEASKRLRERVRNDPAYARELLEEIGYFEMMADEQADEQANGAEANGTTDSVPSETNGAGSS